MGQTNQTDSLVGHKPYMFIKQASVNLNMIETYQALTYNQWILYRVMSGSWVMSNFATLKGNS